MKPLTLSAPEVLAVLRGATQSDHAAEPCNRCEAARAALRDDGKDRKSCNDTAIRTNT